MSKKKIYRSDEFVYWTPSKLQKNNEKKSGTIKCKTLALSMISSSTKLSTWLKQSNQTCYCSSNTQCFVIENNSAWLLKIYYIEQYYTLLIV